MKIVLANKKRTSTYIYNEKDLKQIINENKMSSFYKLPLVKVGDFVTCCDIKDGIDPLNNHSHFKASSWKENKVVKVDKVEVNHSIYYIAGTNARSGIYASGVRFSTQEEIETYNNDNLLPL